ncbi:MAG: TVP38/TMEM64 family protein [Phycisphaerales bacterium JB039]
MTDTPTEPAAAGPAAQHGAMAIIRRLGPASALAAAWAILPAALGFALLANLGPVSSWLHSHQEAGPWIYGAVFAVTCGLGLLPTYAQAILGGWAFGLALGAPVALAAVTAGATIGFLVARVVSRDRAERLIQEDARAIAVRDALIGKGPMRTLGVITLLRLPPNSPFAVTNLALAATGAPLWGVIVGTAIGLAPRTVAAVVIAANIQGELDKAALQDAAGPRWVHLAISVVLTLAVVVVIGMLAKRALEKVTAQPALRPETGDQS